MGSGTDAPRTGDGISFGFRSALAFDVPTDPFDTLLEFVGGETDPYSEPIGIPEDIAGCEDDAFGLEQRTTELRFVLEPVGNGRKAVYARRLEPLEIVAPDELGDAFSFAVARVRFASRMSAPCSPSACCSQAVGS